MGLTDDWQHMIDRIAVRGDFLRDELLTHWTKPVTPLKVIVSRCVV
ncbi:hypothetical protein ABID20_002513 [Rhizobium alvei]